MLNSSMLKFRFALAKNIIQMSTDLYKILKKCVEDINNALIGGE